MNRPEEITHRAIIDRLMGPLMKTKGGMVRMRKYGALPHPWLCWHTPNGGGRSKAEAGVLKAMGTMPGIPDLFVAGEGRVIGVEVKAPKGSPSPAQRDTIAALAAAGIPTVIVRSIDEAEAVLRQMGVPLRGRTP